MIELTEQAILALSLTLKASGGGEGQALRLKDTGENLALEVDTPSEQDHVVEHEGTTVLVFDQQVADRVGDVVIDVQQTAQGSQLVIRPRGQE